MFWPVFSSNLDSKSGNNLQIGNTFYLKSKYPKANFKIQNTRTLPKHASNFLDHKNLSKMFFQKQYNMQEIRKYKLYVFVFNDSYQHIMILYSIKCGVICTYYYKISQNGMISYFQVHEIQDCRSRIAYLLYKSKNLDKVHLWAGDVNDPASTTTLPKNPKAV